MGGQQQLAELPMQPQSSRTKYFVAVGNAYSEIRASLDSDLWRTDVEMGSKWDNLIRQGYKLYLLFIVKDSEYVITILHLIKKTIHEPTRYKTNPTQDL